MERVQRPGRQWRGFRPQVMEQVPRRGLRLQGRMLVAQRGQQSAEVWEREASWEAVTVLRA